MSVVYSISPDILGPIASAAAASVATWWFTRFQRQAAAEDRAVVTAFMRGGDEWLADHQQRFAAQPPAIEAAPDVTGEVIAVEHHDVDEDAPADDTERAYLWVLVVVALVMAVPTWLGGQFGALWAYLSERLQSDEARAREWEQVEGGPWSIEDELRAQGKPMPDPEPVQIVPRNTRYRSPGETGQYPLVKVVGDKAAGRHRKPEMPINIPAQREGGEDL